MSKGRAKGLCLVEKIRRDKGMAVGLKSGATSPLLGRSAFDAPAAFHNPLHERLL